MVIVNVSYHNKIMIFQHFAKRNAFVLPFAIIFIDEKITDRIPIYNANESTILYNVTLIDFPAITVKQARELTDRIGVNVIAARVSVINCIDDKHIV